MYSWVPLAVFIFTIGSVNTACEDILVVLPDDNVLLRYFDHFDMIGRYKKVGQQLLWTQVHGRHQIVIETARNSKYVKQLSFLASSQTSNITEYIGLDARFSYTFDAYDDSDYIYNLHEQLFSWNVYNHTFNESITTYTYQFDELYIYCTNGDMLYSVCTGDRVLNVNLYLNHEDGSQTVLNDRTVNVFKPVPGLYRENRAVYVQDELHFTIKYVDTGSIRAWTLLYNSTQVGATSGTLSTLYVSSNHNEAAPVPELSTDYWIRYPFDVDDTVGHAVVCSARVNSCAQCNSTNTDVCLPGSNSSLYYCVCTLGYEGETCNKQSAVCPQPPEDVIGWVPSYYQEGPFYSGEIITVSCIADYPSLLSRWKYITTCTDSGEWAVERLCIDYSFIDASVSRSNHSQVILALLEEVNRRLTSDTPSTISPFTQFVSQYWLIATVLAVWLLLSPASMLIAVLCQKYKASTDMGVKPSLWKTLSIISYTWIWIYIAWEIVSFLFSFSQSSSDLFIYMDIFTAAWLVFLYLFHVLTMFLCPEMSVLGKAYPVLTSEYIDAIKSCNNPELSVTVERYYMEEITKNILKTNDNKRICKETKTSLHPVVTECFRQAFSYETCRDVTESFPLEAHTIVNLQLNLQVSFGDEGSREEFYDVKSRLEDAYKTNGSAVNVFQVVALSTEEHQLRRGLDVIVHAVVGKHTFYTNVWLLRVLSFLLLGVPLQLYLASRVIKPSQKYNVRKVISGVRASAPVRASVLNPVAAT